MTPDTRTRNAVGEDGTAVMVVVTALPSALIDSTDVQALMKGYERVTALLDVALCGPPMMVP